MKYTVWFISWLILLTWACASYGQVYPLPDRQTALLGELKKDCYGPALSCDGTGRAFHWHPEGTQDGPNVVIEPKINTYGFGRSSDQFGRTLTPALEQTEESWNSRRPLSRLGKVQEDE